MQAIQTKFFGPTNTHGSKLRATCAAGSVTVPYDFALTVEANHVAAAQALRIKLNWHPSDYGEIATGQLKDGSYVHVMLGVDGAR